jgi:VWFA-related protein
MAGEPLRLAMRASQAFLRALKPADRSMVWAISESAEVVAPLGAPRDEQLLALAKLTPWSTTALHDSVIAALDRLAPEPGRQALVLFTDGSDRYSRASAAAVIDRVRRSNALVYGIGVGRTGAPLLVEMAAVSGGRSLQVRDAEALEPALASIARELQHQYLLGYSPPRREDGGGRWRSITVRVAGANSGIRVRARDGYVAP